MWFIFLNDIYYSVKKYFILYLIFLVSIISFPIYINLVLDINLTSEEAIKLMNINIGIKYGTFSLIEYSVFILNIAFYTFISVDIFLKDLEFGLENIFLRMSTKRWLICKLMYIFILTLLLSSFEFVLIYKIYAFFGLKISITFLIKIFIIDLFLKIILQLVGLNLLMISKKNSFLITSILYTLPWISNFKIINNGLKYLFLDIYVENIWYIFLIIIIEINLLVILNKKFLLKHNRR